MKSFQVSLNSPHNSNFGASEGPWHRVHRPSGHYAGPHGCSSTRIVTKWSLGATKGFHEKFNFKKLSRATKQLIQWENGSVLTGKGPYVGADWGYLELGPGTPAMGWGLHIQEKSSRPRSKYTHSGHNTQRSFDPPPPTDSPPPKRVPRCGGVWGVNIKKNHWGIILGPKMMILQGVRR